MRKYNYCCLLLSILFMFSCQSADSNIKESVPANKVVTEKTVKPKQTHIKGVDVSHYQGKIDWTKLIDEQCYFAYAQATDGITFFDPMFSVNWTAMKANGIYRGAYHFFQPEDDPIKQADSFIKAVKTLEINDLPPMLDLEIMENGISKEDYQQNVLKWLTYVEEKLGKKPFVYTNPSFANNHLNDKIFSNYILWIAEYGVDAPKVPNAWVDKGWAIWQFNSKGKLNGINGHVDMDTFKGDLADFKAMMSL